MDCKDRDGNPCPAEKQGPSSVKPAQASRIRAILGGGLRMAGAGAALSGRRNFRQGGRARTRPAHAALAFHFRPRRRRGSRTGRRICLNGHFKPDAFAALRRILFIPETPPEREG